MSATETGQTVKLDDLIDKKEQFYGKIVTVDGEMHRIFTDRIFTIEDDDLVRDDDVLIISDVPREQTVVALEKSIEPGKNVRVTGFVHEYDREKLECLYGPLKVESREGHSFTKSPVLIVQKVQLAEAKPSEVAPQQPVAAAEPEPQAPAIARAEPPPAPAAPPVQAPPPAAERALVEEAPAALPSTAGGLPLVGLLGFASILTAWAIRVFHA
jgi:predicted RNA-binding protein